MWSVALGRCQRKAGSCQAADGCEGACQKACLPHVVAQARALDGPGYGKRDRGQVEQADREDGSSEIEQQFGGFGGIGGDHVQKHVDGYYRAAVEVDQHKLKGAEYHHGYEAKCGDAVAAPRRHEQKVDAKRQGGIGHTLGSRVCRLGDVEHHIRHRQQ